MLLALRFFTVNDFIYAPICLIILYVFIRNRAEKNADPDIKKIYYRGFYFKIICVLGFTLVTEFIFKGGDTGLYYQGILDLRHALSDDYNNMGTIIKTQHLSLDNPLTPYFYYDNYADDFTYGYMTTASNFFVPRLGLLPAIAFFNNYLCLNFIFGFFALGGAIRLFKFFHFYYPNYKKELAIAAIFLPSVGFWSAGLLKDPICFGSVGYILYGLQNIFVRKRNFKSSLAWIIVCGYLVFYIKVYILLVLVMSTLIWLFSETNQLIADKTLRNIFSFLTLIGGIGVAFLLLNYFTSQDVAKDYKLDTLLNRAEYQRQVISDLGQGGAFKSNFTMNTSSPIILIPNSLAATFFRPFPWEINSPVMLFSAIESAFLLFFTVNFFIKRGIGKFFKFSFSEPRMLMCFVFAMVFAVSVGASTNNFGALSRYKIPCMPFYFVLLILLYRKANLPYPAWFNRILNFMK
jgi:hypothetical protein